MRQRDAHGRLHRDVHLRADLEGRGAVDVVPEPVAGLARCWAPDVVVGVDFDRCRKAVMLGCSPASGEEAAGLGAPRMGENRGAAAAPPPRRDLFRRPPPQPLRRCSYAATTGAILASTGGGGGAAANGVRVTGCSSPAAICVAIVPSMGAPKNDTASSEVPSGSGFNGTTPCRNAGVAGLAW